MSKTKLPVMIGKNLHKGVMTFKNGELGGYDMYIVWLKKDHKNGESFELSEIDKIGECLHFCDKDSIQVVLKALQQMLENWED